jgi:hypothetical protein
MNTWERRELIHEQPRMKKKYQTLTVFNEQCLVFFCDPWILGLRNVLLALYISSKHPILEGWSLTSNMSIQNYIFIVSVYMPFRCIGYSCLHTHNTMDVFCTVTIRSVHSSLGIIILWDKFGKWNSHIKLHW